MLGSSGSGWYSPFTIASALWRIIASGITPISAFIVTFKNDNGQAAKADILENRAHNDKLTSEDDNSSVHRMHWWGRHYL